MAVVAAAAAAAATATAAVAMAQHANFSHANGLRERLVPGVVRYISLLCVHVPVYCNANIYTNHSWPRAYFTRATAAGHAAIRRGPRTNTRESLKRAEHKVRGISMIPYLLRAWSKIQTSKITRGN